MGFFGFTCSGCGSKEQCDIVSHAAAVFELASGDVCCVVGLHDGYGRIEVSIEGAGKAFIAIVDGAGGERVKAAFMGVWCLGSMDAGGCRLCLPPGRLDAMLTTLPKATADALGIEAEEETDRAAAWRQGKIEKMAEVYRCLVSDDKAAFEAAQAAVVDPRMSQFDDTGGASWWDSAVARREAMATFERLKVLNPTADYCIELPPGGDDFLREAAAGKWGRNKFFTASDDGGWGGWSQAALDQELARLGGSAGSAAAASSSSATESAAAAADKEPASKKRRVRV